MPDLQIEMASVRALLDETRRLTAGQDANHYMYLLATAAGATFYAYEQGDPELSLVKAVQVLREVFKNFNAHGCPIGFAADDICESCAAEPSQ